ncbi:MAG: hypothetical protein GXZ11_01345 [Tissierellia bacterium]|nr:hypothetical protein [Tissierellia bacterium]
MEERYKKTYYDDEYNEWSEDIDNQAIDPNMTFEEEQELLRKLKEQRDEKYKAEDELREQQELEEIYDEWVEIADE